MKEKSTKKKEFLSPCALVFAIVIVAAILTWIVPAGQFNYEKVGKITRAIPGSYHLVEQTPQNPWDLFNAVVNGFSRSSTLIFMIMFVGAAINMLENTGSIDRAFKKMVGQSKNSNVIIIFSIMLFMSMGGASGIFANSTVAMIPIGILVASSIGLDKATGMLMVYLGAYSGFNVAWVNASTIGIAQPIAELPVFSGLSMRVGFHIVNFILTYTFVMMYVKKIQKTPEKSLCYEPGMVPSDYMGNTHTEAIENDSDKMSTKDSINILSAILAVAVVVWGSVQFKWGSTHMSAVFLILGIFIGLYNGYGVNGTTNRFLKGCSTMISAAFIVGIANGIAIILKDGQIINTIVHFMSLPLNTLGSAFGAVFMFVSNLVINIFIPSGSGQAATVMPIMVPLADLGGITRQVAVQAFQFGDGLTNCISPLSGVLMGCLGIAGISWTRYAKWYIPFLLLQVILASIALVVLQTIGWTGL